MNQNLEPKESVGVAIAGLALVTGCLLCIVVAAALWATVTVLIVVAFPKFCTVALSACILAAFFVAVYKNT